MSLKNPTEKQIDDYARAWVEEKNDKSYCLRKAFPNSKAGKESINVAASRFHKLSKVRLRIDQLQEMSRKQTEEEFKVSISDIKKTLWVGARDGLKNKKSYWVPALAELNRMDGNHAAEKHEHTVQYDKMSDEELEERLRTLVGSL